MRLLGASGHLKEHIIGFRQAFIEIQGQVFFVFSWSMISNPTSSNQWHSTLETLPTLPTEFLPVLLGLGSKFEHLGCTPTSSLPM
eukprot:c31473_g1_i1 orf=35-289(+)